mgnify:CR=1 FL=1
MLEASGITIDAYEEFSDEITVEQRNEYRNKLNERKDLLRLEKALFTKTYKWTTGKKVAALEEINNEQNKTRRKLHIPKNVITNKTIETLEKYYITFRKFMQLPIDCEFMVIEDTDNKNIFTITINTENTERFIISAISNNIPFTIGEE